MAIVMFDSFLSSTIDDLVPEGVTAKSLIIDVSPDLPAYRRINKAALDTETLIITRYDENGQPSKTFDIDAKAAKDLANTAKSAADTAQITANTALTNAGKAQGTANDADTLSKKNSGLIKDLDTDVKNNATAISTVDSKVDLNTQYIENIEADIAKIDIENVLYKDKDIEVNKVTNTGQFVLKPDLDVKTFTFNDGDNNLLTFDAAGIDALTKPITNLSPGGDTDTNAANIGDVKRIATSEGGGLKPTANRWDMLTFPIYNTSSVGHGYDETGARVGFEQYKVKVLADTIELSTQNDSGHYLDISSAGINVNNLEISMLKEVEISTSAATFGQVKTAYTKADDAKGLAENNAERIKAIEESLPDFDEFIKTDSDASLTSLTFGHDTKIDWRPDDLNLTLQATSIYGITPEEVELFYVEAGNFNVKSKKIQKVVDGTADDDATTVRQLNAVDTVVQSNTERIKNLEEKEDKGLVPSAEGWNMEHLNVYNTVQVGLGYNENYSRIGFADYQIKLLADTISLVTQNDSGHFVDVSADGIAVNNLEIKNLKESSTATSAATVNQFTTVNTLAQSAKDLADDNKDRLDKLPPAPNLDGYARLNTDVSFQNLNLSADVTFSNAEGAVVNFTDHLSFDNGGFRKMSILNGSIDVFTQLSLGNNNQIINLKSGGDNDANAANIGDVKRIIAGTEDKGLVPIDDKWNMLGYPMIDVSSVGYRSNEDGTRMAFAEFETKILADKISFVTQNDSGQYGHIDYEGLKLENIALYGVKSIGQASDNTSARLIPHTNSIDLRGAFSIYSQDGSEYWLSVEQDGVDAKDRPILNLASGEDNNTRAANIGDVKRIAGDAPNLDEYAKLGENVNFDQTLMNELRVAKADDHSKFSDMSIDGNTNTQMNLIGDTHIFVKDKETNAPTTEALQIDSSGRVIAKQKIKTSMVTAISSGSTDSTSENTGYVNFSEANTTEIGAHALVNVSVNGNDVMSVASTSIQFAVDYATGVAMRAVESRADSDVVNWKTLKEFSPNLEGYAQLNTDVTFKTVSATNLDFSVSDATAQITHAVNKIIEVKVGTTTNVEYTSNGMKLGRDMDSNNQNITNSGDISFSNNAALIGHGTGNLSILNLRKISRNDSNDANSVTLDSGFNSYKSNAHNFSTNDDVDLLSVDTDGLHLPNLHADSVANTTFHFDSDNQNTVFDSVGQIYFNTIDRDSGEKHRVFLTNAAGNATFERATRSKEGFTSGTATFNTNTEGAAFVDFRETNECKLGAHSQIKFAVAGKVPLIITGAQLDFSGLSETMKINHDHNIDVIVSGTTNVAFKSNGMKLVSQLDGNGQNINHCGDIHFNAGKKLFGSSAGNLQLRYVNSLWRGDGNGSNIQFDAEKDIRITGDHIRWFHSDGTQYGGVSKTGINLRDITKIVGLPEGEADTDAANLGQIKALIAAGGGGGGAGMAGFKKHEQITTGKIYYQHRGDDHIFTEYNGNGGVTIEFDSMRTNEDIKEDMFCVHNNSNNPITVLARYNQSGGTRELAPKSYMLGWANRDIAQWVFHYAKDPEFVPQQTTVSLTDLPVTPGSNNRDTTKNIIAAMEPGTTCIAYHNPGSGKSKYNFITMGKDGKDPEGTKCPAVIHKYSNGHATGFSTTEGSGRVYSRVLDGTTGIWNTNDTTNTFALQEDIPDDVPEGLIFLTGDAGILESYVDEDAQIKVRPVEGYNVPLQEKRIDELEVETELNKSVTHNFVGEERLIYDWPNPANRPTVDIFVLDTSQTITDSSVDVVNEANHDFNGHYNTVGSICVSNGIWTNKSFHNCYKLENENKYLVFSLDTLHWLLIIAENPHTEIGKEAIASEVTLGGRSQLPASFGDYTIDVNFADINSLEFIPADANKLYDDENKHIIIDFNGSKPSGRVILN